MSDAVEYLVDTSTLSVFAPGRPRVSGETTDWMKSRGDAGLLRLSVITVAEIERGIRSLHRRGGTERAKALAVWLTELVDSYGDRLLSIDAATARIAGEIEDRAMAGGVNPGFADVLIAATAQTHGLELLTSNERHFEPLGIICHNPLEELPTATAGTRPRF